MEFSPRDWAKILPKKISNPDLQKVIDRQRRKPKPDTSGVTPGRGSSRTPRGENKTPGGKIKPHRSG